jgi:hypothetical protein
MAGACPRGAAVEYRVRRDCRPFDRGDIMKLLNLPQSIRLGLMGVSLAAVAALGLFGTRWVTPALAQGTVAGPCGTGLQAFSLKGSSNVTNLLDVNIGSVQLLSNRGGTGTGAVRPLTIPIDNVAVNLVPMTALKTMPTGVTALTCGIQPSAKFTNGQEVTYVTAGQKVCFDLPAGAAATYETLKLYYYDAGLGRWVALKSTVGATEACHTSFRLAPVTFVLGGSH